jgi:hypothetical protein
MPLSRPSGFSALESHAGLPAAYGDWEKRLPSLAMFMCDLNWQDGSSRVPGKLTLWTGDTLWKACLTAPETSAIAFWSAQDPSGLLQAIEKALGADKVEWRRSVPYQKRSSKR